MKLMYARLSSVICMLLLLVSVAVPTFAAGNGKGQLISQDIQSLAKQMDAPTISEVQKKDVSNKLMSLNRDEVLSLKKLWRAELVAKGVIGQAESAGFTAIEKIEMIFSEKIAELFGEDATIFNISSDDFVSVERALSEDIAVMELMYSVENAFKAETSESANAQLIVAASTCYYDNNWPQWLSATSYSGTVYKGGGVGRVKSTPNE